MHDSCVPHESFLKDFLDRNLPDEYYLLEDEGFQFQTDLLTPYLQYGQLTELQIYYNDCLSKTKLELECVIDMMKKKVVYLTMPSHYQPEEVCGIIKACVFLWSYGLMTGDNKGYDPCAFAVKDKEKLDIRLSLTMSGRHLMVDLFTNRSMQRSEVIPGP